MFAEVGAVWCSPFHSLHQHVCILQERKRNKREAATFTELVSLPSLQPQLYSLNSNLSASHINPQIGLILMVNDSTFCFHVTCVSPYCFCLLVRVVILVWKNRLVVKGVGVHKSCLVWAIVQRDSEFRLCNHFSCFYFSCQTDHKNMSDSSCNFLLFFLFHNWFNCINITIGNLGLWAKGKQKNSKPSGW